MSDALLRIDAGRDAFVEWMHERGTCVEDILRSDDVRAEWHRLLCAMQQWQHRLTGGCCHARLPRVAVTLEEIVAQRRVVRVLLPHVEEHAALFCATLASLLALHGDDPAGLLGAIDAAMTDDDAPANTSQARPRVLVSI
jgi:hypothetical protein